MDLRNSLAHLCFFHKPKKECNLNKIISQSTVSQKNKQPCQKKLEGDMNRCFFQTRSTDGWSTGT